MKDTFNREINYLRISVTDRCDLRCIYCMKEKMEFLPKSQILSVEEINRICSVFINLGIKKIHGKELSYNNYNDIYSALNILSSFKKNRGVVIIKQPEESRPIGFMLSALQICSDSGAI